MILKKDLVVLIYLWASILSLAFDNVSTEEIEKRNNRGKTAPTESWWRRQWYLSDTAVSMNVQSAWQAGFTGKGILVAVVDDGVKIDHPDLKSNFNLNASYDFLENHTISKRYNPASHGTKCAGLIAGGKNNICGVGVAYEAQISSIRIFDDNTLPTDVSTAEALSFKRDIIDVYSNSWGPGDMGWRVEGPGRQLKRALEKGVQLGRHGKGSIFVFAAGNGGIAGDSCAFSGYVNNIYTIAISGVNWDGSVPAFTEQCAGIMAVTYGQDMFSEGKVLPPLVTAEGNKDCTDTFPGSSGTAAIASGIIALALQANQLLTWRDVQHLIARSSKPLHPPFSTIRNRRPRPTWITNAANLTVSSHYGFGLMDARDLTNYAKNWHSVPQQLSCQVNISEVSPSRLVIPVRGEFHITLSVSPNDCSIRHLEHVQAEVNLRFSRRGYLKMFSVSPSGTKSRLLYPRWMDTFTGYQNFTDWRITSLHYWGENPTGDWNVTIKNTGRRRYLRQGQVFGLKLIFYGTKEDPLRNNSHVDRNMKRIETVDISSRRKEIPINGGYSHWSRWSPCSRSCGRGIMERSRSCNYPAPENGGKDCRGLGRARETKTCYRRRRCRVDGGYSQWTLWSQCSATCGNGTQQRHRSCSNPPPSNGGRLCSGPSQETRFCFNLNTSDTCSEHVFPIHGGYTNWNNWTSCSQTCGGGLKQRSRSCTNPRPANKGRNCSVLGPATETKRCRTQRCPACTDIWNRGSCQQFFNNGYCSQNVIIQKCKKTCGQCQGIPIDGGYTKWGPWSRCSRTCAGGLKRRIRFCTNPQPEKGGRDCSGLGPAVEARRCSTQRCPACTNTARDSLCQTMFNNGYCQSNRNVRKLCKKSCFSC